jgi:hypothetical protein
LSIIPGKKGHHFVELLKNYPEGTPMNQKQEVTAGELITPTEAATIIGTVTKRTITKWCRQGLLPAQQINQRWYINKAQFLKTIGSPPGNNTGLQ